MTVVEFSGNDDQHLTPKHSLGFENGTFDGRDVGKALAAFRDAVTL